MPRFDYILKSRIFDFLRRKHIGTNSKSGDVKYRIKFNPDTKEIKKEIAK